MERITFIKGAIEDLSGFADRSFDLVMSFDAPISYTYPHQERVIGELVRIAKKKIIVSVSGRLGYLPYLANPIQKNQFILDDNCKDAWVKWCIANRNHAIEAFKFEKKKAEELLAAGLMGGEEEIAEYERGGAGAYARTIPNEILVKIMRDEKQRQDFLDFCYRYDSNPYVCGMGKDNLLAKGDVE